MPVSHSDVLFVGGGVIGLTAALHLAEQGVSVTVADRQRIGQEASWAGAGMLPPGTRPDVSTDDPLIARERYLRCTSNQLWPEFSARLRDLSGLDNGYRPCGALELGLCDETLSDRLACWKAEDVRADTLTSHADLERHVPAVSERFSRAVWLPDFCQVRNPRHLKALYAACQTAGVHILENVNDLFLQADGNTVRARSPRQPVRAATVCVTAGAWTDCLLAPLGIELSVHPVRGQIVQLRVNRLPFTCVIEQGTRYLVPRTDGLILIGSTEEDAGFVKQNTSQGIRDLLQFSADIVPELDSAQVVRCWSGLRPALPDRLPRLGRISPFDNLYVASGHFRSGLQMSPATAHLLSRMLLQQDDPILRTLFPPVITPNPLTATA